MELTLPESFVKIESTLHEGTDKLTKRETNNLANSQGRNK